MHSEHFLSIWPKYPECGNWAKRFSVPAKNNLPFTRARRAVPEIKYPVGNSPGCTRRSDISQSGKIPAALSVSLSLPSSSSALSARAFSRSARAVSCLRSAASCPALRNTSPVAISAKISSRPRALILSPVPGSGSQPSAPALTLRTWPPVLRHRRSPISPRSFPRDVCRSMTRYAGIPRPV